MATMHEQGRGRTYARPRTRSKWLILGALVVVIAVAIVLLVLYTGGGSGGEGGY